MQIEKLEKVTLAERVASTIRDAIVAGSLRPGDRLPSERDLAGRFGVNRSSVREALHRLEAQGLIRIRQGGATIVQDLLVSAGLQVLPALLAPGGSVDPKTLADLLSIRVMVLGWTAGEAAERRGDLQRLRGLVAAVEDAGRSTDELQVLDFEVFLEMVALTGNRVLALLANSIRQVSLQHAELFAPLYEPATFDPGPHRQALAAIEAGDRDGATRAMEQHGRRALERCRDLGVTGDA